jgi:hypothetical protein
VSSVHSSSSSSREGEGEGGGKGSASVVVVKTGKKKMDHERYLDATQRYVPPSHLISLHPLVLLIFARPRVCVCYHKGESSRP